MEEDNKNQEKGQFLSDELINSIFQSIFSNVKLYVENRFRQLDRFLQDIEDCKLNIATVSTLLNSKSFFSQKEFRNCFLEIEKSFGKVDKDGNMEGRVVITKFNFGSERKTNQEEMGETL